MIPAKAPLTLYNFKDLLGLQLVCSICEDHTARNRLAGNKSIVNRDRRLRWSLLAVSLKIHALSNAQFACTCLFWANNQRGSTKLEFQIPPRYLTTMLSCHVPLHPRTQRLNASRHIPREAYPRLSKLEAGRPSDYLSRVSHSQRPFPLLARARVS